MARESSKRKAMTIIFNELKKENPNSNVLRFNNKTVKQLTDGREDIYFSNQFDATKFESFKKMPEVLQQNGFFIIHLGKGEHAFVKGEGYHKFEPIPKENIKDWNGSGSFVDSLGNSEAGTVSELFNNALIRDFLFGNENITIDVHTARRSRVSYDVVIGETILHADKQQIEIDGLFETKDTIAAVEVKNVDHEDFEVRQLFNILKYFESKKVSPKRISRIVFVVRVRNKKEKKDFFRLYEYKFTDNKRLDSIELVKNAQYNII